MGYQALYRVWRPQSLSDFAGQEHITKTLQNALAQNKFSHAYLFTGPRGTGKTSAAKIVAKAVNCEKAPVPDPCNECKYCKGITDGSIVDIIEFDAASQSRVENIRDILDKVKYAPTEVRYKVYIIDEVHMLSTEAFNALLKTLEEPPRHVIFILATTEPHKVPLTIVSRCQRFDFKQIPLQEMIDRMRFILSHYDIEVTEEALQAIAKAADGGMRDALSILDQAISYAVNKITLDDVLLITGSISHELLTKTVQNIEKQNTAGALELVDLLLKEGKDPEKLMEDLIFYFRDLLLYKTSPNLTHLFEKAKLDDDFMELAERFSNETIYEIIEKLSESEQQMRYASSKKIFLELSIVKLCQYTQKPAHSFEEKIQQLEEKVSQLQKALATKQTGAVIEEKKQPSVKMKENKKSPPAAYSNQEIKQMLKTATKKELKFVLNKWAQLMEVIRRRNIHIHAWLMDGKPVAANENTVILSFQNEMHRDMIDQRYREEVSAALLEIFGYPLQYVPILAHQWELIKKEYMEERSHQKTSPTVEPIVSEAVKLVGKELVEIIDNESM